MMTTEMKITETAAKKIAALEKHIEHVKGLMDDRHRRINEGLTDMDDCFVSQRSNEQSIALAKAKIRILENGGLSSFNCLKDLETDEVVSTKLCFGKWGPFWVIKEAFREKFGKYVNEPKREHTLINKGLTRGEVELPAWACMESSGSGMLGAFTAFVKIFPSNTNHTHEK